MGGRGGSSVKQLLAVMAAGALLLGGCSRQAPPPAKLTVLCGGSFRPAMERFVKDFQAQTGIKAELSFGQVEDLLPQVKIGQKGDVFVLHDPYLEQVDEAGYRLDAVQVGYVAPVLVVAKGNPAGVQSLEDLAKPKVKVALPDPEFSTCGQMLLRLLEKKGIKDKVVANAEGAIFRSHAQVGTALELGGREAGVMWNGVARNFRDSVEVIPTPYEYDEEIRVWIVGLSYTKQERAVRELLDFAGAKGKQVFADYGYVK